METYYSHLNKTERTLIKDWKNQGISLREIGYRLNRSHTTISRELRRNGRHYYIRGAQELYERRLKHYSLLMNGKVINLFEPAPAVKIPEQPQRN
jgi:IS30 family transposase